MIFHLKAWSFWRQISPLNCVSILHCLTVSDEVRPSFQNRSIKPTGCASASITSNASLPDAVRPNQDPPPNPGPLSVPLVNNRKGSLLPRRPGAGAGAGADPSKLRLSISGPGDVAAGPLAESRLSRARSLPVKYRYHPSNAMLLSHSRHCRLPPRWDASASNPACPAPPPVFFYFIFLHEGWFWTSCCCFARIHSLTQRPAKPVRKKKQNKPTLLLNPMWRSQQMNKHEITFVFNIVPNQEEPHK